MTVPAKVTVGVVDDNRILRMGLRQLLETSPDVHVVGEAGDGEAAVALVRATAPDVVLLDVRMPRMDGVAALGRITEHSRVLMLTATEDESVIRAALAAGACGYLVHGRFRTEDLVAAVLATATGSSVMSAPAIDAVRAALSRPRAPAAPLRPDVGLTDRQKEVVDCISEGLTNRQIARRLFLSEKTVKNHVNHVFARLGVTSRAAAVSLWLGGRPAADGPGAGPRTH